MIRWWTAVALFVAAGAAVAAPPEVGDEWWGVSARLDDLEEHSLIDPPRQLLRAKTESIGLEVWVEERLEQPVATTISERVEQWTDAGRRFTVGSRDDKAGIVLISDRGMSNAVVRHAYRFVVRGDQTFVAHARGTAIDTYSPLLLAVEAVEFDARGRGCLAAVEVADDGAMDRDDPFAAALAAQMYATREVPLLALAARQAEFFIDDPSVDAEDRWGLTLSIALGFLGAQQLDDADAWLERALDLAALVSDRPDARTLTLYNVACSQAVGGRTDAAFETLQQVVELGGWQNHADWAQEDPDLATLREDDRWAELPRPEPPDER